MRWPPYMSLVPEEMGMNTLHVANAQRPAYGLRRRLLLAPDEYLIPGPYSGRRGDPFLAPELSYLGGRYGDGLLYPGVASRGTLLYDHTGRMVDAAASVLRAFARPSGRKVMVVLSGGWATAAETGFQPFVHYGTGRTNPGLLRPLTDTANRLGYTL